LIDKDTYRVSIDYSIVEVDLDVVAVVAVVVEEKLEKLRVVVVVVVFVDD
jgi:hypothetical protein